MKKKGKNFFFFFFFFFEVYFSKYVRQFYFFYIFSFASSKILKCDPIEIEAPAAPNTPYGKFDPVDKDNIIIRGILFYRVISFISYIDRW